MGVVTVDEIPCAGIMGSKSGHIEAMIPLGKHEAGVVKAGVWDHDVDPLRVRSRPTEAEPGSSEFNGHYTVVLLGSRGQDTLVTMVVWLAGRGTRGGSDMIVGGDPSEGNGLNSSVSVTVALASFTEVVHPCDEPIIRMSFNITIGYILSLMVTTSSLHGS